jgi:hypothetical protein
LPHPDDDVIDYPGQPRVGQQQPQHVVVVLQAVSRAEGDQPVCLEHGQHRVSESAAGPPEPVLVHAVTPLAEAAAPGPAPAFRNRRRLRPGVSWAVIVAVSSTSWQRQANRPAYSTAQVACEFSENPHRQQHAGQGVITQAWGVDLHAVTAVG